MLDRFPTFFLTLQKNALPRIGFSAAGHFCAVLPDPLSHLRPLTLANSLRAFTPPVPFPFPLPIPISHAHFPSPDTQHPLPPSFLTHCLPGDKKAHFPS